MRLSLAIVAALVAIPPAAAETALLRPQPDRSPRTDKTLPVKGRNSNPCAAYGAGFVKVEGTGSCVKIGGAVDVGVGVRGRR